ncbi:aldehyde dehydrogenase (NADP(+)) [Occallatibacter riparius]|uniref:Aldehyde dehydrogenase (NADP(+)) n=1 Tax=Occallatibacter riparius TaxID=1002689 RepID=A0A9J7BPK6_9BACT|nr:aldehyde dehydrogenase (NADP(+)) [Occallatibacter riparius]UWZ82862.1 aldehyde dehydrogenase (NADP(+)) [Occallatibacter riparius]
MELTGLSFLGNKRGATGGRTFQAANPASGEAVGPVYHSATVAELDQAVRLAAEAFESYSKASGKGKAAFLRRCADGFDARKQELAERANLETALPITPRLVGEIARTAGQLRLFASMVEEGSWVQARIDPALPERQPLPRVDLRSMLRPLGPVAVFGASNFPLAFSVAGGDTASALAAGCPVVVKAHPAHPGTSEIAAEIISEAVAAEGLHRGVFTMVYDAGVEIGSALVQHPLIKAVAFTGSLKAGRALMDLAAARPTPIPCFTEMSSGNPVFVLPSALRKGPAELAKNLFGSVTLGAGQMCTKPGIVLVPEAAEGQQFFEELKSLVEKAQPFTLLTAGIAKAYGSATNERAGQIPLAAAAAVAEAPGFAAHSKLFTVRLDKLIGQPELADEIFGPDTLLVHCDTTQDYVRAARSLDGHLTASILGDEEDLIAHRELVEVLEQKAGRLIVNGFPTGVEVAHAMVHGGPYPSTSDPRFTSVGSQAIYRFAKPVCFQNFPQALLPAELQDANPLGIRRLRDGNPE